MKTARSGLLAAAAVLPLSCATTEAPKLPPHVNVSPEDSDLETGERAGGVTLGLETEANESDSLERLEVLPGVRVARTEPSGPAAAAGIRPGDVILSAGGVLTNDPDAFTAVVETARDGSELRLEVRRGTLVFEATVIARRVSAGAPPRELYRIDPVKTRAGYVTDVVAAGGERLTAARIVRLFPRSPLPGAGFRIGDHVLAVDGHTLASAQDLVTTMLEHYQPGDSVAVEVLRGGERIEIELSLWEPDRRLSALALYPLFTYETQLEPSRTEFSLLDFFIISLFSYRRNEGEREYSFLSLIRFGTGYGELIEEEPPQEKEAP